MDTIPKCPVTLPAELDDLLCRLAEAWRDSDIRPTVKNDVLKAWDRLLEEWLASDDLPLLVRKIEASAGRGYVVTHQTGRKLVPTDNTPANWSLTLALEGKCPSLGEIRDLLKQDKIPVAMVLKREERKRARFTCTRATFCDLNKEGWKVCHKRPVGIKQRSSIAKIHFDVLANHFRLFLAPSNMFLVPKVMAGLGELPHIIAAIQDREYSF